jgi:DNA-binding MarR family transcriptional regulator/ribosomal protein S18 acetylase RimI-like enzyme
MLDPVIPHLRDASRRLVRELGFMKPTLAGTDLPPSAVHALIEIGASGSLTAADLSGRLNLDKSSISRMVRKLAVSGELAEAASARDGREKLLSLTSKGRRTLAAIDAFAEDQVGAALGNLAPGDRGRVGAGLAAYAGALEALRTGVPAAAAEGILVESGYLPGVVGRSAEMHARYYARTARFGQVFESKVAAGLAEFVGRLDRPVNGLWTAVEAGTVIGTVAIDGEDLGGGAAHLRWFIVEDGRRGSGVGRRLLAEAVAFADRAGFAEIQLWTFSGLDAARRLYEASGFVLAEEMPGRQWGKEVTEQRFVRRAGDL